MKLVEGINLALADKEYNPTEVLIDFKDSDISEDETTDSQSPVNVDSPSIIVASTCQDNDEMDKLCALCIGSKSTQVVRQNKTMTPITKKLEEVYVDP